MIDVKEIADIIKEKGTHEVTYGEEYGGDWIRIQCWGFELLLYRDGNDYCWTINDTSGG